MRCSLFEIEHYCATEGHVMCPVYRERTHTDQLVSTDTYETKLSKQELQHAS